MNHRQRLQHQRIDQTENRRVRADPQSKRKNRDRSESRSRAKCSQGIAKVLEQHGSNIDQNDFEIDPQDSRATPDARSCKITISCSSLAGTWANSRWLRCLHPFSPSRIRNGEACRSASTCLTVFTTCLA